MRPTRNYVLVKVENRWNETIEAPNGMKFYRQMHSAQKEHDIKICAEVIGVPDDSPCIGEAKGVKKEIKVGDLVYFRYTSLMDDSSVKSESGEEITYSSNRVTDDIFRVKYSDVFCSVRDGEIIPIGGWCLIEPEVEDMKVKSDLIIPFSAKVKSENVGYLRHIGSPLEDEPDMRWMKGKKVYFRNISSFENKVEGKTYYCMVQKDIYGEVEV